MDAAIEKLADSPAGMRLFLAARFIEIIRECGASQCEGYAALKIAAELLPPLKDVSLFVSDQDEARQATEPSPS